MAGEGGAAVLQVLVQNLIDLSKSEISLIRGLDREAQKLTVNLGTLQQFLNDAETQTITSGAVKNWLKRLENVVFEADNVLDELNYHALSKTLNTNINKQKVPTCLPFIDYARKRKMAVSIKEINMNLKSINKTATELGLQRRLADAPTAPYAGVETDSFSADPIFIGRDDVLSEIVETLITSVATYHQRVFSILPIVGMGGMGKTALTSNVFHHQNMETRFGSRIWVHVSQVFDPINLFKKILKELTSSQSDQGESRQEILRKLQEALKDKTYLLVLDDVWNEDLSKWEDFLNSLSGVTTTKGNGIIVTTRNTKVASIVRPLHIHHLKGLSEEDCWSIIRAKTFGNEDVPLDFDFVGRKIAERCGGLPLAASVVGGVLCDKSADEWHSIKQNWLSDGEGDNNITKILRLSINNLSLPSLKKCFAYCSIFPKGDTMVKEEVIEMWMGEGFLGSNDMESVGDKFYNVLLHSSLLQVAKREGYGSAERCVMHDLVHDLASSVLGNADGGGVSRVRYLIQEWESSPIKKEVAGHLRTLIFRADQFSDTIFSDFKCLHVLTLTSFSFKKLPRSIRKLIHLRDLNISETRISHLPDWIGEFHHLQTLRAEHMMEKLPNTIKYLINLRHLHVPLDAELPAEIGRLTSFQTLRADFIVRDTDGYKIEELGSLNNLKGSLSISNLENVQDKEEAEKANLSKKSKLSELRLIWSYDREEVERNDEKVLEGLQPHSNIRKLAIRGFDGKRFPVWILKMAVRNEPQSSWIGLNQLVEIEFFYCTQCEEIPMLGHLPNLKSLSFDKLSNVKSIDSSFYGIGKETVIVFPMLERLSLINMPILREWAEVESDSTSEVLKVFPHLQSLEISGCNQLMKAPTHFSSCLKSLYISGMTESCLPLLTIYMSKLTSLTDLVLKGLNGLECLPDELFYNNPNLSVLKISKCPKLREIPHGLQTLNSLKKLIIKKCADLKRIGCSSGGSLISLGELEISECHGLMDLPYEMVESSAPVLEVVKLKGLSSLNNLPRIIDCFAKSTGLTELTIVGVPKFMATSVEVWHFPKLLKLEIDVSIEGSRETSVATKETVDCILRGCSCDSLYNLSLTGMEIWECLPESIQHLTSLERLNLKNFGMQELPEWFDRYISHTESWFNLKLSECKRLRRLPSTHAMQLLIKEERVAITGCPEFQKTTPSLVSC